MATRSCDQAAPNFPSAQNNLEIAQQSMSPSMFKHYQTYMQDMSTMQQTFLQTFREEFTELITMATMIAKTATPPPDKGGTELNLVPDSILGVQVAI